MSRLYTFLLFLVLSSTVSAQQKMFISAEAGWSDDHYRLADPGGRFLKPVLGSGLFGIAVRRMISPHVYLETGLYTREYHEGLSFAKDYSTSGTGRRFGQLPMRVGGRWQFFGRRFSARPYAGLALNVTGEYDEWPMQGRYIYGNSDTMDYEAKMLYQTQVFFLVQTGLSVEMRLGKRIDLGVTASYNWGLQKIQLQRIRYSVNHGQEITAIVSTRGGYNSVAAILSYRF